MNYATLSRKFHKQTAVNLRHWEKARQCLTNLKTLDAVDRIAAMENPDSVWKIYVFEALPPPGSHLDKQKRSSAKEAIDAYLKQVTPMNNSFLSAAIRAFKDQLDVS